MPNRKVTLEEAQRALSNVREDHPIDRKWATETAKEAKHGMNQGYAKDMGILCIFAQQQIEELLAKQNESAQ
jgi:hypothetical protein